MKSGKIFISQKIAFWLLFLAGYNLFVPWLGAAPVLVQDVEGTAYYTCQGASKLLTMGTQYVDPEADFFTEGNSSLFVSPFPGSTIRLDQMSQMRVESITRLPLPEGGVHSEAMIHLFSGKLTAFVGLKNQTTDLTVVTTQMKLELHQALCVICSSEVDSHVSVFRGSAWMNLFKDGREEPRRQIMESSGMWNITSGGNIEFVPAALADPGAKGCLAAGLTQKILAQGLGLAEGNPPFLPIGLVGPPLILNDPIVSPTR